MKLRPLSKEGESQFANALEKSTPLPPDLKLLATLRYDTNLKHLTRRVPIAMEDSDEDTFFLSKIHHKKLKYNARLLGWDINVSHTQMVNKMLEAVQTASTQGEHSALKIRLTVDRFGAMDATASPVLERDNLFSGLSTQSQELKDSTDPVFEVYVDKERFKPAVVNMIKTTDRSMYNTLRERNGVFVNSSKEVLLIGTDNDILEGSITNVAFLRGKEWVTPKLDNGGMVGAVRSFLLELGYIKEGVIKADTLVDGEYVLLFNGVQGVCAGKICLK